MADLIVDVDGVVLRGGRSGWGANLPDVFGFSTADLQQHFFKPHWHEIVTGKTSIETHLAPALAKLAPHISVDEFLTYWFENDADLNMDFLSDIAALRAQGFVAHLGTNQDHRRAHYLMTGLGLQDHFDGIFYSAQIGYKKPSPEFYRHVERQRGKRGKDLIFIDDTLENITAAQKCGWQAVHWTGQARLSEVMKNLRP